MTDVSDTSNLPPTAAQAAEWFARLQGESAGEADWSAFEDWLRRSPEHAAAYARVEALWVELDSQRPAILARLDELAVARPISRMRRARRAPPGMVTRRRLWLRVASAAAAVAVGVVGVNLMGPAAPATTYSTAKGETRQVLLADGTRIVLNGGSQIAVRMDRGARRVLATNAEASFDVAHDPARPFLIAAGDREIRVLGTEFNLRRREGKLALTVRRGVVEVRDAVHKGAPASRLTRGQQLTHRQGDAASDVRAVEPDAAFAWREGRLIYRDQPLDDVVADLSSRFAKPVRVHDARTAQTRFSGVLILDDQSAVLRRLEAFLPVTVEDTPDEIVIRRRGG